MFNKKAVNIINSLPFSKEIIEIGGEIYLVGGCIRDLFLGKEPKDIDIVIRLINYEDLSSILKKYGKVDLVGESFGIIKFNSGGLEVDIALPRTETKSGRGHTGFIVNSNPFLPIEDDLGRRDFGINAIAVNHRGEIYDPYNGIADIENKEIKIISDTSFSDDALRLLRCIQFASRFKFTIEENTWRAILDHADSIKEISGERILTELDKIFYKGDIRLGLDLFIKSTLHFRLFGFNPCITITRFDIEYCRADFYSLIVTDETQFINILKGETKTAKLIKAIKIAFERLIRLKEGYEGENLEMGDYLSRRLSLYFEIRKIVVDLYKISEEIFDSALLKMILGPSMVRDFTVDPKLPISPRFLEINGNELMEIGYTGKMIGDIQREILDEVLKGRLVNSNEEIKKFLTIKQNI